MTAATYSPTYVYGWQIEPWHVWITIICACLLVLSAWLHGVRYGRTLPVAHDPEHLPAPGDVAATERALGWTPDDDAPTPDEAERMLPLQVAYESRSET